MKQFGIPVRFEVRVDTNFVDLQKIVIRVNDLLLRVCSNCFAVGRAGMISQAVACIQRTNPYLIRLEKIPQVSDRVDAGGIPIRTLEKNRTHFVGQGGESPLDPFRSVAAVDHGQGIGKQSFRRMVEAHKPRFATRNPKGISRRRLSGERGNTVAGAKAKAPSTPRNRLQIPQWIEAEGVQLNPEPELGAAPAIDTILPRLEDARHPG
ncbi:MAG TPA: hypothetical protein VFG41_04665 [Sphingomicrobium sp.]|nr:hypothetical protein [Sphingomicrobium sp.]